MVNEFMMEYEIICISSVFYLFNLLEGYIFIANIYSFSCDVLIPSVDSGSIQTHHILQPVVEVLVVTQKTQTNPDGVLFASGGLKTEKSWD